MAVSETRIVPRDISEEMRQSYLDYAMSVIVSRALPDVRDGLKPVQRRILYAMGEAGNTPDRPYRKSAKTVGEVLGNYHPHGDAAVYDALVRMAQDFTLRYPLVDGHGNMGCFTGDTRVRLADGTSPTLAELAALGPDARFYVYSVNGEGRIVIAEGRNARVTRLNAEIVEVLLDNGVRIRCTPDHRFMLRDGTYKEARNLTPADSLMAGYFDMAPVRRGTQEYLRIRRLSAELFDSRRPPWVPRFSKAMGYLADIEDLLREARTHNHRVVAVRRLAERADVYDITVDYHHNFLLDAGVFVHNSVDGDPPAAMRYTEARLSRLAMELLRDLDKDTVDFQPNFDGTTTEPVVLPARFPNLLVNGSSGIAVGMATNIPPHNLGEIVDAVVALIDNPHLTNQDLMRIVRGPDFPTGGLILGREGIARAYETGRGTITLRARATIEEGRGGRWRIVVTELPYEVNKARLLERIAELARDRRVEGIAELRDETDRTGTRVVVELARGANAQVVLNQLYHHTQMQVNYGVILLALVDGQPRVLTLREALRHYVDHQRDVVTRRSRYELARAEERAHILEGLRIALDHIDAVIALIRASRTPDEARAGLREQFGLSEEQAQAILDMRLQRLTGLEREKIEEEYQEVRRTIEYLRAVLASERMLFGVIRKELLQVKERFADPRRTQVTAAAADLGVEDLVADEPNVVTLSFGGYVKRLPLDTYRRQLRGGRGVVGMTTRQQDWVADIYVASTLDWLLFFTSRGRVYRLRVHELPEAGRAARGTALVNLLPLEEGEKVQAVVPVRGFEELVRTEEERGGAGPARDGHGAAAEEVGTQEGGADAVEGAGPYLFLATRRGFVKRTPLAEFASLRRGGMIALTLEEGDELIGARLTDGNRDMALVSRLGLAICFPESDVRPMGRTARGVRGISLRGDDRVVALVLAGEGDLLVVTEGGYGKRTPWSVYRRQGRGGKGIRTLRVTAKNGPIVAARSVEEGDEVLLITGRGVVTRQAVAGISRQGRDAQGVLLMRLEQGDAVVAIATVETED